MSVDEEQPNLVARVRLAVATARTKMIIEGRPVVPPAKAKRKAGGSLPGTPRKPRRTRVVKSPTPKEGRLHLRDLRRRGRRFAEDLPTDEERMHYGGLEDEDEAAERDALEEDVPMQDRVRTALTVPTRTEVLTRISPFPNHIAAGGKEMRKRFKFQYKDIPEPLRARFNSHLVPPAREVAGNLDPWASLSLSDKQALVDRVWPHFDYIVRERDLVYDLIDYRIAEWRTEFRKGVHLVVEQHFEANADPKRYNFATCAGRAAFCRDQLLDGNDEDLPLVWADYQNRKGRFENPLILKVFGTVHVRECNQIEEGDHDDKYPVGALITAKLVVEQVLTYWKSGDLCVPKGTAGYFSQDNWGNNTILRQGVRTPVRKGSFFVATLKSFSDEKWNGLFMAASEFMQEFDNSQKNQEVPEEVHGDDHDYILQSD
ncbi:hypothetical protein OH77DRAFT_1526101 [Trametes cingulata]|nr:hypothetical protein OH77DRAFT_1526101 [Trametes cingulata]